MPTQQGPPVTPQGPSGRTSAGASGGASTEPSELASLEASDVVAPVQIPAEQANPLSQAVPLQHACPLAPQGGTQTPIVQVRPLSQAAPLQHASSGPPHMDPSGPASLFDDVDPPQLAASTEASSQRVAREPLEPMRLPAALTM
jgi:hypothetical protein